MQNRSPPLMPSTRRVGRSESSALGKIEGAGLEGEVTAAQRTAVMMATEAAVIENQDVPNSTMCEGMGSAESRDVGFAQLIQSRCSFWSLGNESATMFNNCINYRSRVCRVRKRAAFVAVSYAGRRAV